MKHLGDITKIDGAKIEPVWYITGGSPCQDLSAAGKRKGLAGERSGLFMEQVRIVKEMRSVERSIAGADDRGGHPAGCGDGGGGVRETFRIDYPKTDSGKKAWNKQYGMNSVYSGKHWSVRRQDAQMWHLLTVAAMNKAQVRKRPFEKPVVISFIWNDRLDLSNHAYMAKLIEDGMKGRLIADDSRKYVKGIEHYWHDAPCIKVIVTEVEENERN